MRDRNTNGSEVPGQSVAAPLDLNLLRTFLTVYRTGSFTAAARLLGLSQPTVTTQIRTLERQLARELFERQARGVSPAPYADELAARIVQPLDSLAAVAGSAGTADDAPAEPVHLAKPGRAAVPLRAARSGSPGGQRCTAAHHAGSDRTAPGGSARGPPRPGDRHVPAARPDPHGPAPERRGVRAGRLPAQAERLGRPEHLTAALNGVPLVAYAEDLPIVRRYWRHVFGRRLVRQPAVTMPDLNAVKAAVVGGAGFTVLPRYLCAEELASGTLTLLHDPDDPPVNTSFLAQRPGTSGNPHVALVRDHLFQAARDW